MKLNGKEKKNNYLPVSKFVQLDAESFQATDERDFFVARSGRGCDLDRFHVTLDYDRLLSRKDHLESGGEFREAAIHQLFPIQRQHIVFSFLEHHVAQDRVQFDYTNMQLYKQMMTYGAVGTFIVLIYLLDASSCRLFCLT